MDKSFLISILDKKLKNNEKRLTNNILSFLEECEGCSKIEFEPSDTEKDLCKKCFGNLELAFSLCLMDDNLSIEELFEKVSSSEFVQGFADEEKSKMAQQLDFIGSFLNLQSWGTEKINKLIMVSYKLMRYDEIERSRKRRKLRRFRRD